MIEVQLQLAYQGGDLLANVTKQWEGQEYGWFF